MPTVSIPGSYIREWVGLGPSIKNTVSFERTAQAWRRWAPRFASRLAGVSSGYLGAAALAADIGYSMYRRYKRSRVAKPSKRGRLGVARKVGKRYGATGRRPRRSRNVPAGSFRGRKRTAAAAGLVARRPRMGMKRRFLTGYSTPEFGLPMKVNCNVGYRGKRWSRRDIKLSFQKVISRWQRVQTVSDAGTTIPGGLALHHATSGTGTATPCYFVRLNQIQNGVTTYTDGPVYSMDFTDTGNVNFITHNSQKYSGGLALDGNWQTEVYDPELSGEPMRYVMNAWYDIRLMLYGCTSQPTVFDIMVISFTRSYLDPLETPSNAQEAADRHALYQGLVQPYMSNPIMPRLRHVAGYRIHKRIRVALDSTLTVENDADPRSKTVKLFVRDGNVYDYRYHDDGFGGAGADEKLSGVEWPIQGASNNDYTNVPAPLARKYLVVRAMNTTRIPFAEASAANTPSFDLIVRKAEYKQSGN